MVIFRVCVRVSLGTTCGRTCWPCRWSASWTSSGSRRVWTWGWSCSGAAPPAEAEVCALIILSNAQSHCPLWIFECWLSCWLTAPPAGQVWWRWSRRQRRWERYRLSTASLAPSRTARWLTGCRNTTLARSSTTRCTHLKTHTFAKILFIEVSCFPAIFQSTDPKENQ